MLSNRHVWNLTYGNNVVDTSTASASSGHAREKESLVHPRAMGHSVVVACSSTIEVNQGETDSREPN